VAVREAVWSLVTALAVAANVVLVPPAATVAVAGMLTAALLLVSETVALVAAALVRVTVQVVVAPARREPGVHVREETWTGVVTVSDDDCEDPL
jgi:hypothetical protein